METIRQFLADPLFDQVQSLLKEGDFQLNKELLLIARHMGLSSGFGNFRDLTSLATDRLLSLNIFGGPSNNPRSTFAKDDIPARLVEFFENPLYCGAIIMSCMLAPLSSEQEERIRLDAMMKEVSVMDSDAFFEDLDFSPFFGHYHNSLAPDIPSNPRMAQVVHSAIDRWIDQQKATQLYPTMSKKLLPAYTRRELDNYVSQLMEEPSLATHGSIEYLDTVEQIRVDGPCEMAQRWYTNQQKPRTYFVSGATTYHQSKFLKSFWNNLVDQLSVTNRFNRVNPSRLHYDGVKQGVFYDLTSFTSNMAVQRRFLDVLGMYCTGHEVTVMDGRHGSMNVDMGELILEYNRTNWMPEYTSELHDIFSGEIFRHGVGGFLGVFGNIATCTFLHGAFLLQLVSIEEECTCAGDDAVAFVDDEKTIWGCVPLIGILAPEKSFLLRDLDVVYLKRRTWMDFRDFRLRQKSYVQLPSMLLWMSKKDLSRFRESSYSKEELRELAASSLGATFRSMARIWSQQGAFEQGVDFMKQYYAKLGFPESGNVPQFNHSASGYRNKLIPSLDFIGSHDYVEQTIISLYKGHVVLPIREDPGDMNIILKKGTCFSSTMSPYLNYLRRLGFIQIREVKKAVYTGHEGLAKIIAEFDRNVRNPPAITVYQIVKDVPKYIFGGEDIVLGSYDFDFSYIAPWNDETVDNSGYMDSPSSDEYDSDFD